MKIQLHCKKIEVIIFLVFRVDRPPLLWLLTLKIDLSFVFSSTILREKKRFHVPESVFDKN